MSITLTKEVQYKEQVETYREKGPIILGSTASHLWRNDPRHVGFILARYKFVSKMLVGCKEILEVGCGDGFGSRLVSQIGAQVVCADFDPLFVEEAKVREAWDSTRTYVVADLVKSPMDKKFDAAYLLDVIEHIPAPLEHSFLTNIAASIRSDGICIVGAPSLESQVYASKASKEGHVNCKTGEDLRKTLLNYFKNVFIFGLNDETLHTGFLPMAHYQLALAVGVKGIK